MLEAAHGRQRCRLGPRLHPFLPRHDVLPELALQQVIRELERAALVEVSVVWPIQSGHGQDANAGKITVLPGGETAQQVERVSYFDEGAA